ADPLDEIARRPRYREFMALKETLPQQCRVCSYLQLCHGGCPRDRGWDDAGRPVAPDYFCAAYRRLFDHAHERFALLARSLRMGWLREHARTGAPWPERNDDCVCGSGMKFKRCCGPLRDALSSGRPPS
ncbi:MAG TPA: SEC-C metal-binding domain-containing protein, partial [Burkholderiales bacterium]|nr:SEC-C metal-binding domain-containing protein [Burkholderiales bacterium]